MRPICRECDKPAKAKGNGRYQTLCNRHHDRKYLTGGTYRDKKYIQFKKGYCEECGFVPQHDCQLDVDHVDENHSNNSPLNLRTLCANCHRLKTYLVRN